MKRSLSHALPAAILVCLLATVAGLLGAPVPDALGGAPSLGFFFAAALLALAIDDYRRRPALPPPTLPSRAIRPHLLPAAPAFSTLRPRRMRDVVTLS